jgi:hypothetical protein
VGKRRSGIAYPVALRANQGSAESRHVRAAWSLPIFAFFASLSLVAAPMIDPSAAFAISNADPVSAPGFDPGPTQTLTASASAALSVERGQFGVTKIKPKAPAAPAAGRPDPGSAKAIAYDMVLARGWGEGEYSCLVALWNRESHWNVYAANKSSGAYGIPQALPGSKMASAGADWQTNAATQITWGLGYISGRYQTPCGAWGSSERRGWY